MYTRDFQTMLDGLDEEGCCGDEPGREKKRRLGVDQVKALEKNFEVDNKLEPERKLKLARELGLQPRQVAIWFQNRRARWKGKQLERDYGVLKSSYDELNLNYEKLRRDNEALLTEVKELKSKLVSNGGSSEVSLPPIEEEEKEVVMSDTEEKTKLESAAVCNFLEEVKTENLSEDHQAFLCGSSILVFEFNKDGYCDCDSSAILNEDHRTNNNDIISSPSHQQQLLNYLHSGTITTCSVNVNLQSSSCKEISGGDVNTNGDHILGKSYEYHQIDEEHNLLGHEESCTNLFCDDDAPSLSLPWYCSQERN